MKKSIYEALQQDFRDLAIQGKLTLENKPKWHDLACFVYFHIHTKEAAKNWLEIHEVNSKYAKEYIQAEEMERFGLSLYNRKRLGIQAIANLVIYYAGFSALADIESQLEEYLLQKEKLNSYLREKG